MTVRADQWDDLATKLVAQEHAHLLGREGEEPLIEITLEHPLIPKGITIDVIDGAPSLGFQFASMDFPADDAVSLMSRAGNLFSGLDLAIIASGLRKAYGHQGRRTTGEGVAIGGMAGLSDDYFISCFALPESTDISFAIQRKK